jgi:protoporphyrinogen oxidase
MYAPVRRIEQAEGKINVSTQQGSETYDRVLFTASPEELKQLADFPGTYQEAAGKIQYKACLCLMLTLSEPVSDYYWVTVAEPGAPFVLYIEHTNLIQDAAYGNKKIVYLSRYLDAKDPLFFAKGDEIKALFLPYIKNLFPHFDKDRIIESALYRSSYAQPVVKLCHSERILPYETPIQHLYQVCMAQIYPEDRGMNYAVRMGEHAANYIT